MSLTRSHKRTSMRRSRSCWNGTTSALQLEEIFSKGTRISCVYYLFKCRYEKTLETYLMILVFPCNTNSLFQHYSFACTLVSNI